MKSPPFPIPVPVVVNATTASPQFVQAITTSRELLRKTKSVVLSKTGQGAYEARVFRDSTTSPGNLSCELYIRVDNTWRRKNEEPRKYTQPELPAGAQARQVGGVVCHTLHTMSDEEVTVLEELVRVVEG